MRNLNSEDLMNKTISYFDNKNDTKHLGTQAGSLAIYEKIKELRDIKESKAS